MNEETLKFIKGDTERVINPDEADTYEAQIHVVGQEVWLCRICVYGTNEADANGLRDRLLWALNQPTVPAQWQYYSAGALEPGPGHPGLAGKWIDLDNGGEAARLKGEGYEIRALYVKQPLKEV